ncbi:MAG TPA: hypothetical protein VD767_01440 [Thermomicrobiales bacterium]|nr:hypothetical protein [Thermomicrobiales bacterium]
MVTHSGTTSRPDQLRPLNRPVPVTVIATGNRPAAIVVNRHTYQVERIQDTWIIEDEWWRQPITRQYFALLLDDGTRRTVFHDRTDNTWHLQDY